MDGIVGEEFPTLVSWLSSHDFWFVNTGPLLTHTDTFCCLVPEQVAAEGEAEHEDEKTNAQGDDVDVEGQVEELFRCHLAVGVRVLQS